MLPRNLFNKSKKIVFYCDYRTNASLPVWYPMRSISHSPYPKTKTPIIIILVPLLIFTQSITDT